MVDQSPPAGITVAESGGSTTVSEPNTTDTFTVVLTAQPTSNVQRPTSNVQRPTSNVVLSVSSDIGEATVAPATLTFTTSNWNVAQTVTVTAVNDDVDDIDQPSTVTISVNDGASDNNFDPLADQVVNVTTIDDDTAGITVTESSGSTSVNETGTTDTFTVMLTAKPLTNVVLSVSSDKTGEATVAPATLTFTTSNWNVAQTVTVTGVDDVLIDGTQTATMKVSVVPASSDDAFDAVANRTVSVSVGDDDAAGFSVVQSSGSTSVNESGAGTTDTFTVVLNKQPNSNVVFSLTGVDSTEASLSASTLTFTTSNWNVAQTVTVTGINDDLDDNDQTSTVNIAVNDGLSDNNFDPLADQTVTITTVDNDVSDVVVTQSGGATSVSETGTTDTLSVQLAAQPTSNVVLTVSSTDVGEATVSASTLTFTTSNWNVAQTVTITGINDGFADGIQQPTILISVNDPLSDNTFDPIADKSVVVDVLDDEVAGFTLTPTDGTTIVSESGSTDIFAVVLTGQPVSNVVLSVSSGDIGEATVAPATLTFTTSNWNVPQNVTVTGIADAENDVPQTTLITVGVVDAASDDVFDPVADQTLSVTTNEDLVVSINSFLDKPDLTPGNGVINTGTANEVTLRAALMEFVSGTSTGNKEFVLPAGTFTFTVTGADDSSAMGDLDLRGNVKIRGAGAGQTIINAGKLDRVFQIFSGAKVELIGLTLQNGDATVSQDGGAIHNSGTLSITNSEILNSTARSAGAIYTNTGSSLSIVSSKVNGNAAVGSNNPLGGAIATPLSGGTTITIVDSQFSNNRAVAGGGAIYTTGTTTISSSLFSGNQAIGAVNNPARGGAIFTDDNTQLTVSNSTFTQNVAQTSGALTTAQANGGAISSDNGSTVTITGSTFDHNQAIGSDGTTNRIGGALASRGTTNLTNVTFSDNSALTDGGAIHHQIGTLSLNHVTVAGNSAGQSGGGIAVTSGTTNLKNTLIATNTATTSNPDVQGAFVSQGHNLIGLVGTATGLTHGANGNIVGTSTAINPLIGPLANNGGPTQTRALLVTQDAQTSELIFSPAVDSGDNVGAPAFDQRGLVRIANGKNSGAATADIGAFELALNRRPDIAPQTLTVPENTPVNSILGRVVASDLDSNLASLSLSGADSAAFTLNAQTGDLSLNAVLDFETKSTYSVIVTATDVGNLSRSATVTINVTNLNESPFVIGSGFDDRTRRDNDTAESVDLRTLFGDPDAGTSLTFTVEQNSNTQLVESKIVGGNNLSLTYLPYAANQDRTPATIRVRASDGVLVAEDTFTITVGPRGTFEYALVVTREVTPQTTLATLPTSLTSVRPQDDFFVEVWVRDLLVSSRADYPRSLTADQATQGIVAAGVDLQFDPQLSGALDVNPSGSFSFAAFDGVTNGLINNLHGESPIPDVGTATQFGRLGAVRFRATGQIGVQTFTLGLTGNETPTQRQANGVGDGVVHSSQIMLGQSVTVGIDPVGGAGATRLFDRPLSFSLGNGNVNPIGLALADFDGRGGIDVATADSKSNVAQVLLNSPGVGHTVVLQPGSERTGINFGNRALAGTIEGVVYRERDNVVGKSSIEPGLQEWTVYLDLNENGRFDSDLDGVPATNDPEPTRITKEKGEYRFTNLLSERSYRVGLILEPDFRQHSPTTNGGLHVIALQAGQVVSSTNFGVVSDSQGASSDVSNLIGFIYRDADHDRVRDAGEGMAGVRVYLDENNDGAMNNDEVSTLTIADSASTTDINEAGRYQFDALPEGTYVVRVASGTGTLQQMLPRDNHFNVSSVDLIGAGPQSVAVGRFNADTQLDLAVANEDASSIGLLLKSGTNFVRDAKTDINLALGANAGYGAFAVQSMDLNNDQFDDLVVTNAFSSNVSVLLNSSTTPGTFTAPVAYSVAVSPRSLVIADVDGINGPDLLVTNELGNNISVLMNNGKGAFTATPGIPLGTSPFALTAVDLTGDSRPELIVTLQDKSQIAILKNDGSGGFSIDQTKDVGNVPYAVTTGDFNGDGKTDIAVGNFISSTISILTNTRATTANAPISFAEAKSFKTERGPAGLIALDLDGDNDLDLAATHQLQLGTSRSITLFKNNGLGEFNVSDSQGFADLGESGGAPRFSIAQGDFNGDQVPDLVVADKDKENVSVLTNERVAGAAVVQLTSASDVTSGTDFIFEGEVAAPVTITLTASDKVAVQALNGQLQVLINDVVNSTYSSIATANVSSLTITGGSGDNLIDLRGVTPTAFSFNGGVGVSITGAAGKDVIFGSAFADSIAAGDGNDVIDGGNANDTLDGGAGLDVLTGGAGSDSINGGTDTDTLKEVFDLDLTLTPTSFVTSAKDQPTVTDVLSGIEVADLTGGNSANVINVGTFVPSTNLVMTITGGGGNDSITGTSGRDSINAGDGSDTVIAGSGNDTVIGGTGNDSINGSAGLDSLLGGDDVDTINGGTGNDFIDAGNGSDNVNGQADNDTIIGGAGNDQLAGSDGNDSIDGGIGIDNIKGDAGDDILLGGDGNDKINGDIGNDNLDGGLGADTLQGEDGLDVLVGGAGADNLQGGKDNDRLLDGDDADSLDGAFGNDVLEGGNGSDTLRGNVGTDDLDGGADVDQVSEGYGIETEPMSVVISGFQMQNSKYGTEIVRNIELFVINGGAKADTLDARGSSLKVQFRGGADNDTLYGSPLADLLRGQEGDDVISGGVSNDAIDGGDGFDHFYEPSDAVSVVINGLQVTSSGAGNTGVETLVGIERIALVGGIRGGTRANNFDARLSSVPVILVGGNNNDILQGSAFDDVLIGGSRTVTPTSVGGDGVDAITGGTGNDTASTDARDSLTSIETLESALPAIFTSLSWLDVV